jgi:hypothetical protein
MPADAATRLRHYIQPRIVVRRKRLSMHELSITSAMKAVEPGDILAITQ